MLKDDGFDAILLYHSSYHTTTLVCTAWHSFRSTCTLCVILLECCTSDSFSLSISTVPNIAVSTVLLVEGWLVTSSVPKIISLKLVLYLQHIQLPAIHDSMFWAFLVDFFPLSIPTVPNIADFTVLATSIS